VTRADKALRYADVRQRINTTLANDHNPITVMAIKAAILKESFPQFFWVGFLLVEKNEMVLGPFRGPPACLRLPLDSKGVWGTCYRDKQTVLVPEVTAFQGRVGSRKSYHLAQALALHVKTPVDVWRFLAR